MARDRGVYNMPGNIELAKEAPLDARRKVNTYAELVKPETWQDSDGKVWLYDGMVVEVGDRIGELFQLKSKDGYTSADNWVSVGTTQELPIVIIPSAITDFNSSTSSKIILNLFGGLAAYQELLAKLKRLSCILIIGDNGAYGYRFVCDNYTVEYTDDNNNIFYFYDNSLKSHNPNAIAYRIQLTNGTASFSVSQKQLLDTNSGVKIIELGDLNLNDLVGQGNVIGYQNDGSKPSTDKNYPIAESGVIYSIKINGRVNQTYQTFNSNRYFIRGAGNDALTAWVELANVGAIPTATSQLNNDSEFITSANVPTNVSQLNNDAGYITSANVPTKVSQLKNDADYAKKSELPTVPTNVSAFTNDAGYAKTSELPTKTSQLTNDSNFATVSQIPTNNNQLTNDAGYITQTDLYGKAINIDSINYILEVVTLSGVDAESRIAALFGSISTFDDIVADILANHTRYYFHIGSQPNNNCIEIGCVNAWRTSDGTAHELHFIIVYYGTNVLYTNRISIIQNKNGTDSKVFIRSLVNNDNISVVTKETKSEYDAINPKNDNTTYAVTE